MSNLDVASGEMSARSRPASSAPQVAVQPQPDGGALQALTSIARRGGLLTVLGFAASQVVRLAGNLVLWRLLHPEAFGLMAIVNVFLQGLHMFSDVGIGPSIIQNKRGEEADYLNTAWTIQCIRGIALFLVATLAARPVASFYGHPELAALIPAVALGAVVAGFNSTRLITATRNITLGRLTLVELGSQISGLCAMVAFAYLHASVWALVIGSSVTAVVRLVLSHTVLSGIQNRLRWDKPSAAVLIRFGRWIFLSTLLAFVVEQSDRLIFGKLVPMSALGVYSIALIWAGFPSQVITNVFNSVLFPVLSRIHAARSDMPTAFEAVAMPWLIFAGWLCACLVSGAPALVHFLYDERASDAGTLIRILGVSTWFGVLSSANATTLLARGRPKWVVVASAAKLVGMVALIPLGLAAGGFHGAVAGFASSELLIYAAMTIAASVLGLKRFRDDVSLSLWVFGTTLAGVAAGTIVHALCAPLVMRQAALLEGLSVLVVVSAGWGYMVRGWRRRAPRCVPITAQS